MLISAPRVTLATALKNKAVCGAKRARDMRPERDGEGVLEPDGQGVLEPDGQRALEPDAQGALKPDEMAPGRSNEWALGRDDEEGPSAQEDEMALSAREALALVEGERERVARSLHVDVPLILTLWGIAWLGGFGITYFSYGPADGTVVPVWLAITVTVALNAVAAVTSAAQTIHRGTGSTARPGRS